MRRLYAAIITLLLSPIVLLAWAFVIGDLSPPGSMFPILVYFAVPITLMLIYIGLREIE